jgi:hypothetical protein
LPESLLGSFGLAGIEQRYAEVALPLGVARPPLDSHLEVFGRSRPSSPTRLQETKVDVWLRSFGITLELEPELCLCRIELTDRYGDASR